MDDQYFVYILYSKTSDKYYIGHTCDINRRLKEHNDLSSDSRKFCVKNGPWELKYYEAGFKTRSDAAKREKQIKSWKSRRLIEKLITDRTISSVGIPTQGRELISGSEVRVLHGVLINGFRLNWSRPFFYSCHCYNPDIKNGWSIFRVYPLQQNIG